MKSIKLSIPAGISAIFDPYILEDPFLTGARGAGVVASNAVSISVSLTESEELMVINKINGETVEGGIGVIAVKTFFEYLRITKDNYRIEISQEIKVPISSGFGTSAASAMGIIFALSKLLKIPLSLVEVGNIAHIAEIRARTGLGTISGLVFPGDIVLVAKPGSPSNCLVDHIVLPYKDVYVILASKGRIETSKALKDPNFVVKASKIGKIGVDLLLKKPTINRFFKITYWFANKLGLMTKDIRETILCLKKYVIGASQAMIGDSIFALAFKENVEEVKSLIKEKLNVESVALKLVRLGYFYE